MVKTKRSPRLDLNPSSADRWTTCTASPRFIMENWDKLPPDDSTAFSKEGTTAHEVAAAYLQDREPDLANCPTPIDADMRWHAFGYMDYVRGLVKPLGGITVEKKSPLWYMTGRNAQIDAAVVNPTSLHIVDYKYGEGVAVSPVNNLQATIYARVAGGSLNRGELPDKFPIFIHIYQPRGRSATDSPYHVWETTWEEIQKLAEEIEITASHIQATKIQAKTEEGFGIQFAPSEKACQWCPAKGFCNHRHQGAVDKLAMMVPEGPDWRKETVLNINQLSKLLLYKADIIKWLNDAEAYALTILKGGRGTIPGFKLVQSRGGNRYWSNPKAAAKLLLATILKREEVISEKVISPAAAEELLGKNKLSAALTNLIARPPGQPVIAPEDDPRESCLLDGKGEFENLDNTDDL